MPDRTHKQVKSPAISARFLADYMDASDRARRSILQDCKYPPIAPLVQHNDARLAVGLFLLGGMTDAAGLIENGERVRRKLADSDFERNTNDINADFIARFASQAAQVVLPDCDLEPPMRSPALPLHGVKVNPQLVFRTRRKTRTNEIRIGGGAIRYAKGKPLDQEVAAWQAALIHGYLIETVVDDTLKPEAKISMVIDCWTGRCIPAPTNSVSRFRNMEAACATIAELWPNIPAPKNAVL